MSFNPAAWVLRRWQFALVMIALVAALGIMALQAIPRTEDPVVDAPNFTVRAVLPGSTPQATEQQLTKPIEDAIYRVDGVRQVRSSSQNDVSFAAIEFNWGTDPQVAYDDLEREMNALRPSLPAGLTRLEVVRQRPSLVSIRVLALASDTLPMRSLDKLARRLRDTLGAIPGIREVKITGVTASEVRVSLDTARLTALGLAPQAVVDALHAAGGDAPIGNLDLGKRRFDVLYQGAYPDLAAVRAVALTSRNGATLHVGDVANVAWAPADAADLARFDGHRAVMLAVQANDGQDVAKLDPAIDARLDDIERTLPAGVRLVRGFDQAHNVAERIDHLRRDFLIALALVSITLLPIGWRAAGVVMMAIPLSLLFGVMALFYLGYSLNQLSIAGFVIALGILVDDAIVVVENIARWLREGHAPAEAVIRGTGQIVLAVLGCTACLIFAFIPLTALSEGAGAFVRSMPVAVFTTVAGSLLVALSAIPLLARVVLRAEQGPEGSRLLQGVNALIHRLYAPLLHRGLDRPRTTLAALLLLSALSVPVVMAIGTSLFPAAGLPQFIIDVNAQQGAPPSVTDALVRRVEARVRTIPGLAWYSASVGRTTPKLYYNLDEIEGDATFGQVAVGLEAWHGRSSPALLADLRRTFDRIPGATIAVKEFRQGPPEEAPVAIRISGPSLDQLARLAAEAETRMQATPGLIDIGNPLRRARTDLRLVTDETAVAAQGVAPGALRGALQLALTGATPAVLRDADGDDYDVRVALPRAAPPQGDNPGDARLVALGQVFVPTVGGGQVPLAALAHPVAESGPATISRLNRMRSVTLTANVAPGVLVSRATEAALTQVRAGITLPPGYTLTLGGEAETSARSFAALLPAIAVSAMGILAVLVLEFGKLRSVAVVFGIVPFGFLGAVVALWVTGNSLSFTASIGLIALVGIEIKNSILLVDFTEQLRDEGLPIRQAVERAGELRFLPVLLTSLTAIGGLLPLALEGNGLYSPVAIVLIGGLISSTLLARIATPVMYLLIAPGDREAVA
jgi:multidrug efflux pump subunit AcrB